MFISQKLKSQYQVLARFQATGGGSESLTGLANLPLSYFFFCGWDEGEVMGCSVSLCPGKEILREKKDGKLSPISPKNLCMVGHIGLTCSFFPSMGPLPDQDTTARIGVWDREERRKGLILLLRVLPSHL